MTIESTEEGPGRGPWEIRLQGLSLSLTNSEAFLTSF